MREEGGKVGGEGKGVRSISIPIVDTCPVPPDTRSGGWGGRGGGGGGGGRVVSYPDPP